MKYFITNKLYFVQISLLNCLLRQIIFTIFLLLICVPSFYIFCMESAKNSIIEAINAVDSGRLSEEEIRLILNDVNNLDRFSPQERQELQNFINLFARVTEVDLNSFLVPSMQHRIDENITAGNSGNPRTIDSNNNSNSWTSDDIKKIGIIIIIGLGISYLIWTNRHLVWNFFTGVSTMMIDRIHWGSFVNHVADQNDPMMNQGLRHFGRMLRTMSSNFPQSA